jgi:hypothetical protein
MEALSRLHRNVLELDMTSKIKTLSGSVFISWLFFHPGKNFHA